MGNREMSRDGTKDTGAGEVTRSIEALCRHIEARVLEEMGKPVAVAIGTGRREVRLFGAWTVVRDDGARRFALLEAGQESGVALGLGIPFRDAEELVAWVEPVWKPWVAALGDPGAEAGAAWARVRARLVNRVRRSGLLPAFRAAVREAYGLDPELERLCWRARAGDGEPGFPAGLCNLVWQWRDAFLLVERETPNLLPLLRAAAEGGLPVEPANPVPGIKRELRRAGVSERFWRVIARSSGRLFLPALEIRGRGKAWDTLVNYARALDQAGVGFEPPAAAMRALVRSRVNPGAGDGLREDWSRADPRLLGMALRQARRRAQSGTLPEFLEEEFLPFLAWAAALEAPPDANQVRAGWRWAMRSQARWHEARARRAAAGPGWESALMPACFGRWELRPLLDEAALWEESVAMRHCVDDFAEECRAGSVRAFSIRDTRTGKRAATLAIVPAADGGWMVKAVKGFANAPAPPALERLGAEVAALYDGPCPDTVEAALNRFLCGRPLFDEQGELERVRAPRCAIELRCEYSGAPGCFWAAFVGFRAVGTGFDVWIDGNDRPGAVLERTAHGPLDWRSAAAELLEIYEAKIFGDLRGYVEVSGVCGWQAEMLELCWMAGDAESFEWTGAVLELMSMDDGEIALAACSPGGLLDDRTLQAVLDYAVCRGERKLTELWTPADGPFDLAAVVERLERDAE